MSDHHTQQAQEAVKFDQLVKEWTLRIASPACREFRRVEAKDQRIRYLALVEAGFTEAQALHLCKD